MAITSFQTVPITLTGTRQVQAALLVAPPGTGTTSTTTVGLIHPR